MIFPGTRVILESPYAGLTALNRLYLRAALRDSLLRGEAPFASHAVYTLPGVLDDDDPDERAHGIAAGFAWRHGAERTAVYADLGISDGMRAGIDHAVSIGQPVDTRTILHWGDVGELVAQARALGELRFHELNDEVESGVFLIQLDDQWQETRGWPLAIAADLRALVKGVRRVRGEVAP